MRARSSPWPRRDRRGPIACLYRQERQDSRGKRSGCSSSAVRTGPIIGPGALRPRRRLPRPWSRTSPTASVPALGPGPAAAARPVSFSVCSGGAIILFEMLLWPRKSLWRGWRLGRTKLWMTAHIWLGLLTIPLLLLHGGFHFSLTTSTLAAVLMWLLVLVVAQRHLRARFAEHRAEAHARAGARRDDLLADRPHPRPVSSRGRAAGRADLRRSRAPDQARCTAIAPAPAARRVACRVGSVRQVGRLQGKMVQRGIDRCLGSRVGSPASPSTATRSSPISAPARDGDCCWERHHKPEPLFQALKTRSFRGSSRRRPAGRSLRSAPAVRSPGAAAFLASLVAGGSCRPVSRIDAAHDRPCRPGSQVPLNADGTYLTIGTATASLLLS